MVNVLVASVGGQGGLTLSRVIAVAAVLEGLSVRTGETLGMAQRYGAVVSFVRLGKRVESPTFGPGEADYLIGLEIVEALRNLHYLSSSGVLVTADELRAPYTMSFERPRATRDEIIKELVSRRPNALVLPARKVAAESGNPRAMNMVLLGAFHAISGLLRTESLEEAIRAVLPPRAVATSIEAFRRGFQLASSLSGGIPRDRGTA
ncbi:MAG: indolepyruvate oxidoreductase subunit beta [Desulfurococcaceae archaeon]